MGTEYLQIAALNEFIESMGFSLLSVRETQHAKFTHRKLKTCACGGRPIIEKYLYGDTWLARCPHCDGRTIEAKNPIIAVRLWNTDQLTEETKMLRTPLTKDTLDPDGIKALCAAMKRNAAEDLALAEKRGALDSGEAEIARWFIRNKKLIDYIESGDYRRDMEERRRYEDDLR